MMKDKEEELDNLFRKELQDPVNQAVFREEEWAAMEQMLDERKKRPGIIYWLPVLGSVAALLLIFIGWLFLKPEAVKPPHGAQQAISPQHTIQAHPGTSGGTTRQPTDSTEKTLRAYYAKNLGVTRHGHKNKSFFIDTLSADGGRRGVTGSNNTVTVPGDGRQQAQVPAATQTPQGISPVTAAGDGSTGRQALAATKTTDITNPPANNNTPSVPGKVLSADSAEKMAAVDDAPGLKHTKVKLAAPGQHPQYALGVLASSDLNGVNSLAQTKLGGNFGLVFSATIKKWTITTGAAYSIKPYLTSAQNYHTAYVFKTAPSSVSANCRMIDIPLNINYQVYSRHRNKITLGTGLSSYIILREDYKFSYANPYTTGPVSHTVINRNHNLFGILNLDATYQHQLNSKMGITLQPYLKLPLSNVGASQVRLQTAGVAVGVNWNLNPFSKK